ncbi:MAG: hypothetical protein LBL75_02665, partial [Rickettsiales bacterium]|nr:hypothetical protein [Rickettsiales bacterium]
MIDEKMINFHKTLLRPGKFYPNYADNNCNFRAYVICGALSIAGYKNINIYRLKEPQKKLSYQTQFTCADCADCKFGNLYESRNWNYHMVAGIIKDGRDIIFDTIMFDTPVFLRQWLDRFQIIQQETDYNNIVRNGLLKIIPYTYKVADHENWINILNKKHKESTRVCQHNLNIAC